MITSDKKQITNAVNRYSEKHAKELGCVHRAIAPATMGVYGFIEGSTFDTKYARRLSYDV